MQLKASTKVEALDKFVSEIEKDMHRLMSIVDQDLDVAGVLRILGYSTTGGVVALIADNWQAFTKAMGLK